MKGTPLLKVLPIFNSRQQFLFCHACKDLPHATICLACIFLIWIRALLFLLLYYIFLYMLTAHLANTRASCAGCFTRHNPPALLRCILDLLFNLLYGITKERRHSACLRYFGLRGRRLLRSSRGSYLHGQVIFRKLGVMPHISLLKRNLAVARKRYLE